MHNQTAAAARKASERETLLFKVPRFYRARAMREKLKIRIGAIRRLRSATTEGSAGVIGGERTSRASGTREMPEDFPLAGAASAVGQNRARFRVRHSSLDEFQERRLAHACVFKPSQGCAG